MSPAAGGVAQGNRMPMVVPAVVNQPVMAPPTDAFAKDAVIAWFRGEFAAANAIIDALCAHLARMEGEAGTYEAAFTAIHRRRMNWIPILQMQSFYSIADVATELNKVAEVRRGERVFSPSNEADSVADGGLSLPIYEDKPKEKTPETSVSSNENAGGEAADDDFTSVITDSGSQDICSNHEECESRCDQIQLKKGFVAKEPVKGHMMNVVRGLKLYEGIFNEAELSKLRDFVNELQVAGRNGELSGDTFILYNQQMKGNKRELIQLGVPIFRKVQYDETPEKDCIEPIPALIEGVIRHLIQWHLIPETRRPNSCIINFFDEGEYSQPFLKPPHLEQPLSTLTLSDSTMAFGRILVSDGEGNYKGTLMLSLKQGYVIENTLTRSLLVMRGNSSDTARHAMCASPNKRISITFFKVRSDVDESESESNHPMMLWQPYGNTVHAPYETVNGGEAMNLFPRWSFLSAPLVMVATAPAISPAVGPQRIPPCGGTGVFLPWAIGSRRHVKHLPPRAQKGRLLALPPPAAVEQRKSDAVSDHSGTD